MLFSVFTKRFISSTGGAYDVLRRPAWLCAHFARRVLGRQSLVRVIGYGGIAPTGE